MLCQSLNHQTGVDNLPGEVCHLIKKVEQLVSWSIHSWLHLNAFLKLYESELQQEIDKDSAKYIRHSRQASSASTVPLRPPLLHHLRTRPYQ